jgi:N-acetylglutamate synthase-like GNAT family acetyltransferase/predicted nucleic acid-binding protein
MQSPRWLALDTSCVVNLLSPAERPDEHLLKLFRAALGAGTRVTVTPVVEAEVLAGAAAEVTTDRDQHRRFIRERVQMFAVDPIFPERQPERDALARQFLALLWPNAAPGSRSWTHSLRDCEHLASLKLCGGGLFVTLDNLLLRKAQAHAGAVGIEVLHPRDVVGRFRQAAPSAREHGQVVRRARPDDAEAISRLMEPIKSSYPDFAAWRDKALQRKECYVGVIDGVVAGIAVWSRKDDRVVKLATFFVHDDYQGRGLGPHLLFHQLRLWVEAKVQKVYVTVSGERLHVLPFFLEYGFRIEGASARRYKAGLTEFVLSKHLFYERVTDADLDSFLACLSREVYSLPTADPVNAADNWFMPPRSRVLQARRSTDGKFGGVDLWDSGRPAGDIGANALEAVVYPARLALTGREAFLIPIQPAWADALMQVPRAQGALFANTDKLRLRTDNAYYCHPRLGPHRLKGSPVLFYVSDPDQLVAGFARILDCRIAEPEDLFVEFGDIGVYRLPNIESHVDQRPGSRYAGCAMALRFAWWVPFKVPVPLERLRSEFHMEHPQTVMPVPYAAYERLLVAGGIDW